MKRSVYIETTIPSFYYEVRAEPEMIARRESTRRWGTQEGPGYDLFCSALVLGGGGDDGSSSMGGCTSWGGAGKSSGVMNCAYFPITVTPWLCE